MPRYRRDHLRMIKSSLPPTEREMQEYTKDAWYADNLANVRIPDTSSNRWIRFGNIPERFRPAAKQWCRFLLTRFSFGHCISRIHFLQEFLTWLAKTHPNMLTFADLTTKHIDAYLLYCRTTPNAKGKKKSDMQVWYHLHATRAFLEYLELNDHPLHTRDPVQKIIGPNHLSLPKARHRTAEQIKYIPEYVLRQFEQHIQDLPPHYIPLAIILRATGWRISDVLLLKMETCLAHSEKGWWICGDITKTNVLGHKVPITKEVAHVIEAQREWVKQAYPTQTNPKGYLFPSLYGRTKRQGRPMTIRGVNNAFQKLAQQYAIVEENGNVFHIHTHAFRHTKAVELLNNGMSLIMVQQWMAHASPEMTLIYAKILDDTMHTQWEQTVKQGAVCMGPEGGKPQRVEGRKVLDVLSSNALDVERVREHRIAVKLPIGNCCKTPKIVCRFVELPCFNCPAYVLTPDDLPALEAYAEQVLQRVEIGKKAGQTHWVEANQNLLEQKVLPSIELLRQGETIAKEDKYVREYTPEEWAARQKESA
jgi:integrase